MHVDFRRSAGDLTTHERFCLVLLRSRPDTVRRFSLHKTHACTKGLLHAPITRPL